MADPGRAAKRVQGHPLAQIVVQIAAVIGGIAALLILADVIRRMFFK